MKTFAFISVSLFGFTVGALAQSQPPQFTISTVVGNGIAGYAGDGGPATSATLNQPYGAAFDSAGNLYIADNFNSRIRKVATDGTITTVAGTGAAGFGGDGGPATLALLHGPVRLFFDAAGNFYFADALNNRIRKVTSGGIISTVAGNGVQGFSGDGGPATSASLNTPVDEVLDAAGNLFIADQLNNVVRKVDTLGIITTVAGNGIQGDSGDGGPATQASLNTPTAVTVTVAGDLLIADANNSRIRKVSNGIITTVAGTGAAGHSGDGGIATRAQLDSPIDFALDAAGNLYITEVGGSRIRVLLTNGTIWTIAGTGSDGYGGDGGSATNAELNKPRGVTTFAGRVYVGDTLNNRVRLLTPVPQAPSIAPKGIVPIYSSSNTIQPDSWVSIYGSNLATGTATWNGDFPVLLGGISVTINGKSAYLWYVSPGQINLQAPDDTATGIVNVVVTTPNGKTTSTVTLAPYAPSFSLLNAKYPAAIVLTPGSPGNSGSGYDIIVGIPVKLNAHSERKPNGIPG